MKSLKKLFSALPLSLQQILYHAFCEHHARRSIKCLGVPDFPSFEHSNNSKPRILFYHISILNFGGTEKFLQILAKYIDKEKYDIYFMYSPQPRESTARSSDGRKDYLENTEITLLPFSYTTLENLYPFFVKNMKPHIYEVIKEHNIDLIITAGTGYPEYPLNTIRDIPLIYINIFGSPNLQENVTHNICISNAVADKIRHLVPEEKIKVMYIQSEEPHISKERRETLRDTYDIPQNSLVFGRIGRADNGIYDPIGIQAFKKIIEKRSDVHYLIMSPPPVLVEKVAKEQIPNVHFIDPSSKEEDVWAFHSAIDVLAHFRHDGESFGLNIAESMLAGNPIVTHRSHIWNAHLEYLDDSFSRVADKDDVDEYAHNMEEMIRKKESGELASMGENARQKAESLFLIKNNIKTFEGWIDEVFEKSI